MKKGGLFCFSPPVMIATFALETIFAVYVIWRYKLNPISRLVVLILIFLATYQLAEYMICEVVGLQPLTWSRIGYVAITMLPALGIHLAYEIAGAKKRPLLLPAYITTAAFIIFFVVSGNWVTESVCLGNYVIFDTIPGMTGMYALFYYGWLSAGVYICMSLAGKAKTNIESALKGLAIGYLAFLVPTTTVNLLDPGTLSGIPSIMCGFAVLLALTLVLWVLPKATAKK